MTKLEEKLIELGYVKDLKNSYEYETFYFRLFDDFHTLHINVEIDGYITHSYVKGFDVVSCQGDIFDWQQAFNQLQQDLEVLKKYE